MRPLLVVNADDFGLEEEINSAIIKAHQEGIVTSASLLAAGPAFESAVAFAKENPNLGVGAHLSLTRGPSLVGTPLLQQRVPSLIGKDGLFPQSPVSHALRIAFGAINLEEVELEFRAQIDQIISAGISITHIDSHQHIHLMPPIFKIVLSLASAHNIRWVRMPIPLPSSSTAERASAGGKMKREMLGALARWNIRKMKKSPVKFARYHTGIEHAGDLREERLIQLISHLPDAVVEISCHPGADDVNLSRNHPWNFHWQQELAALCSRRVRAAVDGSGVRLVNYREI